MARPSKPAAVIKAEGKSHRTKAELEVREKAEAELMSGAPLYERREVKKNKVAHAEFLRVAKLMRGINKDDALYSSGINTYCQLYAEINEMEKEKQHLAALIEDIGDKIDEIGGEMSDIIEATKALTRLISSKNALGNVIDNKRKLMLAIDKENVMTVSAALRSIPKTPEKQNNALLEALTADDDEE